MADQPIDCAWSKCWLYAIRTYLDHWVPIITGQPNLANYFKDSSPSNSNDELLNVAFRIIKQTNYLNQSDQGQFFEIEQALFHACHYLAMIGQIIGQKNQYPIQPSKLRQLWINQSETKLIRLDLLKSTFIDLIGYLNQSQDSFLYDLIDLFESSSWIDKLALDFQISSNQCKHVFVQAILDQIGLYQKMGVKLLYVAREFLNQLMDDNYEMVWEQCISISGYPQQNWSLWTWLHALYHIEPPPDNKLIFLDDTNFVHLANGALCVKIELFRLKLIRFSLIHGPRSQLTDFYQFMIHCLARLDRIEWWISKNHQSTNIGQFHYLKFFKSILKSSKIPNNNNSNTNLNNDLIAYQVPLFYKSIDDDYSSLGQDALLLLSKFEIGLWFEFLSPKKFRCDKLDWAKAALDCLKNDCRLAMEYMKFGCFNPNLFGLDDLMKLLHFQDDLSSMIVDGQWNITNRIQLIFIFIKLKLTIRKDMDQNILDVCISNHKNQTDLVQRIQFVFKECLIERLKSSYSSVDIQRFIKDLDYQKQTIYGLCSTSNPLFGFKICLAFDLDIVECLFSFLDYLFLDNNLLDNKWSNLSLSILAKHSSADQIALRVQSTIYPFLNGIKPVWLFMNALLQILHESIHIGRFSIRIHMGILNRLTNSDLFVQSLFETRLNYSNFIQCLFEPIESYKLFTNHLFFKLLAEHKNVVIVFGQIIDYLKNELDSSKDLLKIEDLQLMYLMSNMKSNETFDASCLDDNIFDMFEIFTNPCQLIFSLELVLYEQIQPLLDSSRRRFLLIKAKEYFSE